MTECQHVKMHVSKHKTLDFYNVCIAPRDSTNPDQAYSDNDTTNCMTYILDPNKAILTGDFNAYHPMCHSPTTDHCGFLIANSINNSGHLTLNRDTPNRHPTNPLQQPTSRDITTATNTIHGLVTWTTLNAINSDHKPILITYNIKTKFRLVQHKQCFTNYNIAD